MLKLETRDILRSENLKYHECFTIIPDIFMIRPGSDNSDPHQDGSCEDLGFHSIEYEDYKVEFECISKQKGIDTIHICCMFECNHNQAHLYSDLY